MGISSLSEKGKAHSEPAGPESRTEKCALRLAGMVHPRREKSPRPDIQNRTARQEASGFPRARPLAPSEDDPTLRTRVVATANRISIAPSASNTIRVNPTQ